MSGAEAGDCPHGEPHPSVCMECLEGAPRISNASSSEHTVAECRSCHAWVVWVITPKGKRMPLDAEPSVDGRFAFTGGTVDDGRGPVPSVVYNKGDTSTRPHFTSHYATCPEADSWRKS